MDEKNLKLTDRTAARIQKEYVNSYISIFTKILKTLLERGSNFRDQLTLVEMTRMFKKKDKVSIEKYCPTSVVSPVANIFERIIFNRINLFLRILNFTTF